VARHSTGNDDSVRLLHYPGKWFEFGLLDDQFLQEQVDRLRENADSHAEHYRYGAFRRMLVGDKLDDEAVHRYIELAGLDEDRSMAESALVDLLNWSGLTSEQLAWLSDHPSLRSPVYQRIAVRQRNLRELRERGPENDVVNRIVESNDAKTQRILLERRNLSREHLEVLFKKGATSAVRNVAATQLNRYTREPKKYANWRREEPLRSNAPQEIVQSLRSIITRVSGDASGAWMDLDVTMPQMKVLMLLRENGALRVGVLARHLNVSTPTITGIVDRLVRQDLVKREGDPSDRRVVLNVLTPKGEQLMERLRHRSDEELMRVIGSLSPGEADSLAQSLQLLTRILDSASRNAAEHEDLAIA